MSYQDRWVRGATVAAGDRSCADRYALIRPVLETYHRPFTVWDLGANLGYFGCRIAAEFDAVSVMVDQRSVLADVVRENALPKTIAMTHQLTANDLIELAQSEHADVVLCLNVLHHIEDWRRALPAVLALGEAVIIETPGRDDVGTANYAASQVILDVLTDLDGYVFATSPSHVTPGIQRPMFLFRRSKSAVTASYAYRGRVRPRGPHPVRPHLIDSTPIVKAIRYDDGEARPWHQGMNLWNWLQMGGVHPDRATVQQAALAAAEGVSNHGDFKPWNLILQGQSVAVIDSGHRHNDDALGLSQTVAWIAQPEQAYAH